MPRTLAGAGRPLRPEELQDWLYLIGRRPPGEHRPVAVWLAEQQPHLLQANGRPTRDFLAERRRRRWQELGDYGASYFARLYRPGDASQPGDDDDDRPTPEDPDPRRLLGAAAGTTTRGGTTP
jgi:hypothetical protein